MPEHSQRSTGSSPARAAESAQEVSARLLRKVIIAWPNESAKLFEDEEIGEDGVELYQGELREMVKTFGTTRVERSVVNLVRTSEHLPRISEIRDGIEPELNPASRYEADCECKGTGWITVPAEGVKPQSVKKCDCWKKKARPA